MHLLFSVALWTLIALSLAGNPAIAAAQPVPLYDGADGATCEYANRGARLRWRESLGDWIDARGTSRGSLAFQQVVVADTDKVQSIRIDLTELLFQTLQEKKQRAGVMLRMAAGGRNGIILFASREADDPTAHPVLVIEHRSGLKARLRPVADTTVECGTRASLGRDKTLAAGGTRVALLEFEVAELSTKGPIASAVLELATTAKQYGDATLAAFRLAMPQVHQGNTVPSGLAAAFPRDLGISSHPDVIVATGFEDSRWRADWSYSGTGSHASVVTADPAGRFEPHNGKALHVVIPKGKHLGLDMAYEFMLKRGVEPEEIYMRYYLRFAEDWLPTRDGGKLPGISATYGKAGWGGRKADPLQGWSLRGSFETVARAPNPLHTMIPIGTYAYHADGQGQYGEVWDWVGSTYGLLERNRWYSVEQYVKLNTPGRKDGVFRAWIDGRLAFEKKDARLRDISSIRIEKVWMNVYHGGTDTAPQDMSLYIDDIVVAKSYIGPSPR